MKFSTLEIIGLAFLSGLKISEIAEELIEEEKEEKEETQELENKRVISNDRARKERKYEYNSKKYIT